MMQEQCPPEESEEPLQQQLDEANRNLERLHGEMEDIHIQHQSALEQLRAEYASELQASVDRVVAQHEV